MSGIEKVHLPIYLMTSAAKQQTKIYKTWKTINNNNKISLYNIMHACEIFTPKVLQSKSAPLFKCLFYAKPQSIFVVWASVVLDSLQYSVVFQ